MWTRTQNQHAQAWSQEAAAAQLPVGEEKTTGQLSLPTDTEEARTRRVFYKLPRGTDCCQAPHGAQPSNTIFRRPPINPSSRWSWRPSRVHPNTHSRRPFPCPPHWTEDRELFGRRIIRLCPAKWLPGFLTFEQQSGTETCWFSFLFLQIQFTYFFTARIWMSNLLTINFDTSYRKEHLVACGHFPLFISI